MTLFQFPARDSRAGGLWRTTELKYAGPKDVAREAERRVPSGVVCCDLVELKSSGTLFLRARQNSTQIQPPMTPRPASSKATHHRSPPSHSRVSVEVARWATCHIRPQVRTVAAPPKTHNLRQRCVRAEGRSNISFVATYALPMNNSNMKMARVIHQSLICNEPSVN
jgi:hypothetical protein